MSIPEPIKPESLIGQLIDGRYRVSREIAVGGMGVVYEAKHVKIGRSVAIKVLHRDMAGDAEVVGRFLNEARAMGTIGHPNIVACTDFGELPGHLPYLVLEYLDGRTLGDEIAASGPMPVVRALRIGIQVASALEAAHARGVIHRDLTSGNVFLTKTDGDWDHVKVLDFGISKFLMATESSPKTRRGFTMGTPEFMAPEQVTHPDVVDARVDIYSLGVILYQMLSGKTPFGGVPVQTLFLQVVNELPPPIEREDIPEEVLALLDRALAKSPGDRFADMTELGAELAHLAPQPSAGGDYSGRVEAIASVGNPRPATGSRPALRTTTGLRQPVTSVSSAYLAARRTSLVEMAAAKAGGGEPAPRSSRRPLLLGAIGLAAAAAVAGIVANRGHDSSSIRTGPVASAPAAAGSATPAPVGPMRLQVTSATPNARVTFRARVHQLPYSAEVAADSKPEVVEITAPGREGRRFWLTIDHPMRLSLDLSPGRGILEASTEEALVALGERPAEPTADESTSDASGGRHSSTSSHRLAARSKVVVAAVVGAKKQGPTGAPVPPAPESPSGPPAPAAATSPPTAPAPEPAIAAPPPPRAPAPEPPPPPVVAKAQSAAARPAPAAATTTSSPPVARGPVVGTIDAAKVQEVFREHAVDVQRCHQRAKIDNSDIHGKLTMKIAISTSGQVIGTTTESSNLKSATLEACIAAAVKGWPFPPAIGAPSSISHVFVLR